MRLTFKRLIALLVLGMAMLIAASELGERAQCLSRWGQSGMAVRYGVMDGCMLSPRTGVWVPATAYREAP